MVPGALVRVRLREPNDGLVKGRPGTQVAGDRGREAANHLREEKLNWPNK